MPKFSVIIPLYNKVENIGATVQSVLHQSIGDFELIIVDDGSKDGSDLVVEKVNDPRIKLIRQPNGGVSNARNNGIRNAIGDYVCFLDADDLWEPDFLQIAQRLIDQYPEAEMFCPSYQVAYGNRVVHPKWRSVDLTQNSLVNDFFEMATAPFWICCSSCVVISMKKLMTMDYWFAEGNAVYEDFDLWLRIGASCQVAHSNEICATYIRTTEHNARTGHADKVVYSETYMHTLSSFLKDPSMTLQQKEWIQEIMDRRMVPYVYSLLMTGNRKTAKDVLASWNPTNAYVRYAALLKCACWAPYWLLRMVQKIRYKVF